jgi:ribosomal protein S18 acetylase RimI-like enzyme
VRPYLENPVWAALTGNHANFAVGGAFARRYPGEVAPFVGLKNLSGDALAELAAIVTPGEEIYLFGPRLPVGGEWTLKSEAEAIQMVHAGSPPEFREGPEILALGLQDAPDMVELTSLVFPGYFRLNTIQMGSYFGIRESTKLIAMAGERMFAGGFREISAVCTHPDYQGRGLAALLIAHLLSLAARRGETSFLHVGSGNERARSLYEKLGFRKRASLPVHLYRRNAAEK